MKAKETRYKNIIFRSQLEAKWAAFFDSVNIEYQYEPININSYLPDFFILGKDTIIVEVKPYHKEEEWNDAIEKIESNIIGTDFYGKEILLLGIKPMKSERFNEDTAILGYLLDFIPEGDTSDESFYHLGEATVNKNAKKSDIDFFHSHDSWFNRIDGFYDGDAGIEFYNYDDLIRIWNSASSKVRWNPKNHSSGNS